MADRLRQASHTHCNVCKATVVMTRRKYIPAMVQHRASLQLKMPVGNFHAVQAEGKHTRRCVCAHAHIATYMRMDQNALTHIHMHACGCTQVNKLAISRPLGPSWSSHKRYSCLLAVFVYQSCEFVHFQIFRPNIRTSIRSFHSGSSPY